MLENTVFSLANGSASQALAFFGFAIFTIGSSSGRRPRAQEVAAAPGTPGRASGMTYYLLPFASGFVGSFHCVGMCGGFACALGPHSRGRGATLVRHLIYNGGRLTTYCFLGAGAGTLGQVLCGPRGLVVPPLDGSLATGQRALAIIAGLLMIAMALRLFGLLPGIHRAASGFGGGVAASLRDLLATPGHAAPLAFGVFNGFLPCPLVYAFAAEAASTAGALSRPPHHGVVRARNLPGYAADGRPWPPAATGVAPARRLAGRLRHTAARSRHPRPRHPAHCRPCRAWRAGDLFSMTPTDPSHSLCSHCLLPVGRRALSRNVNAESLVFCCYGCSIAYQVKNGSSEEWDAAWLLIRLGVGGFLSMNIMLFSLLLYAGAIAAADPRLLGSIDLLLWMLATPAVAILGGLFCTRPGATPSRGA